MAQAYALGLGDPALAEAVSTGVEHYRRHVYAGRATRRAQLVALADRRAQVAAGRVVLAGTWSPHWPRPSTTTCPSAACTGGGGGLLRQQHRPRPRGPVPVTLLRAMLDDDHGKAALAVSALTPVFAMVSR
ncbi:hypothetical protein GCM10020220_031840 [Nonomuraea rubra]|uniref:hypothetical protein n=1 Tax=Nonomuraea rubra TaxID=46180 RepID=UPI0031EB5CBC